MKSSPLPSVERIESRMLVIRGQKVMLDASLAGLYEVTTKALNQAVKRNLVRFPGDFMIQLAAGEATLLRSQSVTLKTGRGRHRKCLSPTIPIKRCRPRAVCASSLPSP